jgi:hypothetical protein
MGWSMVPRSHYLCTCSLWNVALLYAVEFVEQFYYNLDGSVFLYTWTQIYIIFSLFICVACA